VDLYSFDDEYLRRLREGDRWTEDHFLRYFRELLSIKLRSRLASGSAMDDIQQEVFVRVFRALRAPDGIRDGRKLGSFVNSVCNNVLLESFRAKRDTDTLDEEHNEIRDESAGADQMLVTAEAAAQVRRVLAAMELKDAALLRAAFLDDRDKDEICREYGVDRGYLRVLLHRAKERFRSALRVHREASETRSRDTETAKPSLRH
jgi:RNA polymerase sigma-70 factor, ECF subfamily